MAQPAPSSDAVAVLRAAVGHGLADGPPWPLVPLPMTTFLEVFALAGQNRLLGSLALGAADGSFAVTAEQHQQLTDHHTSEQAYALRTERLLLRVAEQFSAAGIDFRFLKGLALASTVYSDPAWRSAGDIDVLVPSDRFDDAVRCATKQLGGVVPVAELRPGFDREFGKEALVRVDGIEVDIHRTFVAGPFGLTVGLDELFATDANFQIGGQPLPTLDPTNQFLHACYNTALGDNPVRLGAIRDLLLCRDHPAVDIELAVARAERWQALAVVQRAAELVVDHVGPTCGSAFVDAITLDVPRRQQLLLSAYLSPARSYTRPLMSLLVIPGAAAKLRYGRALISPSSDYLRSRGLTTAGHARRALDRLRRR